MVFPIGDDNSDRVTFPFVTIALIVANVFVFAVLQQGFRPAGIDENFTMAYVQVPAEIISGQDIETEPQMRVVNTPQGAVEVADPGLRKTPIPVWLTLLTAIFMHGSVMHLLGNMWFLWVFGDNVEDRLGRTSFLAFYLACGVAAAASQVAFESTSQLPMIGASGAVAGVLGAYLRLYPRARVSALFPLLFFWFFREVSALFFLGGWFVIQVGSSLLGLSGVAWWAHIAGFLVGLALSLLAPGAATAPGPGRARGAKRRAKR